MASEYTILPFGANDAQVRQNLYVLFQNDTVRDCADAVDALATFDSLLSGEDDAISTGFSAFDAQVKLGYHYSTYLATVQQTMEQPDDQSCDIVPNFHWQIKPVALNIIEDSSEQSLSMIAILGNRIAGPLKDYQSQLATLSSANASDESCINQEHTNTCCPENTLRTKSFLSANHDRLSLSFFADHSGYPFPLPLLPPGADDDSKLYMESIRFPLTHNSIEEPFFKFKSEVNKLGAGKENMGIFRWEHTLAETPGRVARMLREWEEAASGILV
ncbi:hypothetical protein BDV06DRAFT_227689 [Aspergillus oleicola]